MGPTGSKPVSYDKQDPRPHVAHGLQPVGSSRDNRNGLRSNDVTPSVNRSAVSSPMALENLKPWPEQGLRTRTLACAGWRSMTKSSSGVFVYMQTAERRHRPASAGA